MIIPNSSKTISSPNRRACTTPKLHSMKTHICPNPFLHLQRLISFTHCSDSVHHFRLKTLTIAQKYLASLCTNINSGDQKALANINEDNLHSYSIKATQKIISKLQTTYSSPQFSSPESQIPPALSVGAF